MCASCTNNPCDRAIVGSAEGSVKDPVIPSHYSFRRAAMNVSPLLHDLPPHLNHVVAEAQSVASNLGVELYLVGGPVRDLMLKRAVVDLDFSVVGDAAAFAHALAERAGGALVAESPFGTAKVAVAGIEVDVASARIERYKHPGALPTVGPATILEDLARRDFTVNAMAVALHGKEFGLLLDPHGGQADIDSHLLRVLHDISFQDDATRMLRGVRFAVRLGFGFESKTEALLRRDAGMLDTISGDRLHNELFRLLQEPDPAACLRLAGDLGLLQAIHPALGDQRAISGNVRSLQAQSRDSALLLAAMVWGLEPEDAKALASRLSLSRGDVALLEQVAAFPSLRATLDEKDIRPSKVVRLLKGQSEKALQVAAALERNNRVAELVRSYLGEWRHIQPMLSGDDLQGLGVVVGPRLGEMLQRLRDARLDGEVSTREDEVGWVREFRKSRG